MKHEFSVLNADGTVEPIHRRLLDQLYEEAARGTLKVNLRRGPEPYGTEAFYTLSDGTVLHEVNSTDEDGTDYRVITLVVKEAEAGLLNRLSARVAECWSPAAKP